DGWWDEMFNGENGWAISSAETYEDLTRRDEVEAESLFDLLERQIVPLFYERYGGPVPRRWVRRVKASLRTLGPQVSASRMVRDYVEEMYEPAAARADAMAAAGADRLRRHRVDPGRPRLVEEGRGPGGPRPARPARRRGPAAPRPGGGQRGAAAGGDRDDGARRPRRGGPRRRRRCQEPPPLRRLVRLRAGRPLRLRRPGGPVQRRPPDLRRNGVRGLGGRLTLRGHRATEGGKSLMSFLRMRG